MDNVPVRVNNSAAHGRNTHASEHKGGAPAPKKAPKKTIVVTVIAVLVAAVLAFGVWSVYRTSVAAQIDANRYQAVFFTNGQVYFGKLDKLSGGYFKLSDIFYLQAESSDDEDSTNPQETSGQDASDVQLVKLGGEIHGPQDSMIMGRDQVLFFENLKDDSTVVKTITEYHKNEK